MINFSSDFMDALANDNRNYLCYATITLLDGTVLELTNSEIWDGGFEIEDAVSDDNEFQVGTAVIGSATLVINNIYDDYSAYDFDRATVVLEIGLEINGFVEKEQKGVYIVDEPEYNGSTITLGLLDYMSKFDVPYTESLLTYPATLRQIVADACSVCDVNNNAQTFRNSNYVIEEKPVKDGLTFRDVLCFVGQIACMNARVDRMGYLEYIWYDFDTLASINAASLDGGTFTFTDGDTADGGNFSFNETTSYDGGTFSSATDYHQITSTYSLKVSTDDVVVTGIKIEYEKTVVDSESGSESKENAVIERGTMDYAISIENNLFITEDNVTEIANLVANAMIGLSFRKADVSHPSDPSFEAGDIATVIDRKGRMYCIIVSRTNFKAGDKQDTISAAETPSKNSATRFTEATKNYVRLREQIVNERNDRQQALETIQEYLDEDAPGLFYTETTDSVTGETQYNWHNKPMLSDSDIIWRLTRNAFGVSSDGGQTWNFGATSYGDLITQVVQAVGINAGWIKTGELVVKDGDGNTTFSADVETGDVYFQELDMNFTFSSDGIDIGKKVLNQDGTYSYNGIYLHITPDRMEFRDTEMGGEPVAYFSSQKLYITNAEVLYSLTLGRYAFIPQSNGNLTFRMVQKQQPTEGTSE